VQVPDPQSPLPVFAALDRKIMDGMERPAIPGAAVGVVRRGRSYMRGYVVTDVSNPQQDGNADTLFHPASIAKTFVGTAAMRLVDQRRLVLDQRVDSYVDGCGAPAGAQSDTVRQCHVTHTTGKSTLGWERRREESMKRLPASSAEKRNRDPH
jgi:CubicO group peptidase (beta-lactamase class C family)